jgi:hypothetical protein
MNREGKAGREELGIFSMRELAIALLLLVFEIGRCAVNPISNPNPV